MKLGRKAVIASIMVLAGSLTPISGSHAMEKCFAALPDSAWADGEPAEVTAALSYDLVGKTLDYTNFFGDTIFRMFFSMPTTAYFLLDENTTLSTYTYEGKNCATRMVAIKSIIASPRIATMEELKLRISESSTNFTVAASRIKALDSVVNILDKKTIRVKVDNKLTSKTQIASVSAFSSIIPNEAFRKIMKSLHGNAGFLEPYFYLKFDPKCLQVFPKNPDWKAPAGTIVTGFITSRNSHLRIDIKFKSKTLACKSNLYLATDTWGPGSEPMITNVGTITFKPA